jgi:hypothetical protein
VEKYLAELPQQADWAAYLSENSHLPGPRANLELAYAVLDLATRDQAEHLISGDSQAYSDNSPQTFAVLCGWIALGKFATTSPDIRSRLRTAASDRRWRIREAVAMALQAWGRINYDGLVAAMQDWAEGSPCEQRAVVAGLCEPDLLKGEAQAASTLYLLDRITSLHASRVDPRAEEGEVLRKGLSYGWSVAVAAHPELGKSLMEKWMAHPSREILRIMKENLTKKRLEKMDPAWVNHWGTILA